MAMNIHVNLILTDKEHRVLLDALDALKQYKEKGWLPSANPNRPGVHEVDHIRQVLVAGSEPDFGPGPPPACYRCEEDIDLESNHANILVDTDPGNPEVGPMPNIALVPVHLNCLVPKK